MELSKATTAQGKQDEIVAAYIQAATIGPRGSMTNPIDPFESGIENPHHFCRNRVQRNDFLMRPGLWYFCGQSKEPSRQSGYCLDCEIMSCLEVLADISETKIEDSINADNWCYTNKELERLLAIKGAQ